jgi:YVTN family beta-propeller protein
MSERRKTEMQKRFITDKSFFIALLLALFAAMAPLISHASSHMQDPLATQPQDFATSRPTVYEPAAVLYDGANIWVANAGNNTVMKIQASTGAISGTFAVGDTPRGLAYDGANIWFANSQSNSVTKLRASDGASLGTFSSTTP